MIWKSSHNNCPKKCHQPWKVTKIEPFGFPIRCPYSKECNKMTLETLGKHLGMCKHAPEEVQLANKRKDLYLCSKDHQLEFWISTFDKMVNSSCTECGSKGNCRSICHQCSEVYCSLCRSPPCTKSKCPKGHSFLYASGGPNYICDHCGLAPRFLEEPIYDDVKCNYGFCKPCYDALPGTIEFTSLPNNFQRCSKYH
jgi:hypothetical protein